MSSAHKYSWTLADGRTRKAYRAKWVGADGKTHTRRGFDRQADAIKYARDREVEARNGLTIGEGPRSSQMTVKAWSQVWLSGLEVSPNTLAAYEYALKRILASLGSRPIGTLRPSELKAWRRSLTTRAENPLASTTADATAAVLAMMLRAAVQDGLLERSPFPSQRGRHGDEGRVVDPDELLSLEQVRAWGRAMPAYAVEMPLVAATLGLRQGELLGLRLHNVDFLRRHVRVVEQLQTPAGAGVPTWRRPKTAAGVRTVPLPQQTADAINRHIALFPVVEGEPIFRGARGQRWSRSAFGDVWRAARDKAGPPDPKAKDPQAPTALPPWVHWHGLRDVYASSLIRKGVDLRTIMTLLGHTSSEETLRTYARLWPDAADNARQALEEMWQDPLSEGQSGTTGDPAGS